MKLLKHWIPRFSLAVLPGYIDVAWWAGTIDVFPQVGTKTVATVLYSTKEPSSMDELYCHDVNMLKNSNPVKTHTAGCPSPHLNAVIFKDAHCTAAKTREKGQIGHTVSVIHCSDSISVIPAYSMRSSLVCEWDLAESWMRSSQVFLQFSFFLKRCGTRFEDWDADPGPKSGSACPPSHRYRSKVRYRTATDYRPGIFIRVRIPYRTVRIRILILLWRIKIKLLDGRIRVKYSDPDLPGLVRIIRVSHSNDVRCPRWRDSPGRRLPDRSPV